MECERNSNLEELRDRTRPQVLHKSKRSLDLPEKIITQSLRLKSKEYEKLWVNTTNGMNLQKNQVN